MKCVVTGVNERGRSYIVAVTEMDASKAQKIWEYQPSDVQSWIDAIDPATSADWIIPQVPGGVRWTYTPFKPDSEAERVQLDGIDSKGFHTTRSIDFDLLLDGELTMILDEERIALQAGDYVIQQATRHAWKNEGTKVAMLLTLIHRPFGVK